MSIVKVSLILLCYFLFVAEFVDSFGQTSILNFLFLVSGLVLPARMLLKHVWLERN